MARIKWFSEARKGFIGVDENYTQVIQVLPVEYGYDVWVFELYCGTYLTREMAQGAAIGLHKIALDGSTIERWQFGTLGMGA